MTHVAFDRTDWQRVVDATFFAQRVAQRQGLDRVTDRRACAVRLDI